jgi:hypothetical protein
MMGRCNAVITGRSASKRFRQFSQTLKSQHSSYDATDYTETLPLFGLLSLRGNEHTELFPSNGRCTFSCLQSCCLEMSLHVIVHEFYSQKPQEGLNLLVTEEC